VNKDDLSILLDGLAAVGSIVATTIAIFSLRQTTTALDLSRKATSAQLFFDIDDKLRNYNETLRKLRDINYNDDEYEIRRAMGAVERLNLLLDQELVPLKMVKDLHQWRVVTLMENLWVQQRIREYPVEWSNLTALAKRLGVRMSSTF
jgi:hypothetical protein